LKPIAIGPKVLAGLLLQSKNTYVDRQKLEAARIKANEAAEEDFKKRLGKMYVEHKTQQVKVSKEIEDKLREVDELKRILEIRLQAAKALEENEVTRNQLHEELLKENGVLREKNKQYKEQLRAFQDGTVFQAPAVDKRTSSSGHDSATSFSSSIASSLDARKRDRSPGHSSQSERRSVGFKKPWSRKEIMSSWNEEGTRIASAFCLDKIEYFKLKGDDVLQELKLRFEQALEHHKSQFSIETNNLSKSVLEKNEYDHTEFHNLQREFGIPNWAQGRTVSVHFYYGKLLGVLNNVV
jgi:hypothetical protein